MRTGIEQLRQWSQCQRREHVDRLPKFGGAEGGSVKVGEMVHLDPGSEPPHGLNLERANCSLRLGCEADSFESLLDAPWRGWSEGRRAKGEGEHPLAPGPVLYSDAAVDRGR